MAIRKRGDNFQVRVRGFSDETYPTREAAETVELDRKLKKKMGQLYQEKPVTLGNELDSRLNRKKAMGGKCGKLRPKTVEFYEQSREPWRPLDNCIVSSLRRARIEDHIVVRAGIAPVAARNELQFLKATLRDSESRGQYVDPGIFTIDPIRHESDEGMALELDGLDSIAAWLPERVQRIVPFCGLVGLRFAEAVNLDDRMVNLETRTLTIPRDLNKSRKTKPIPLATCEVQILREQMMARVPGTTVLFANAKGGIYTKSGFRSIWLPALLGASLAHHEKNAKGRQVIVGDFKFHWLRHTAISLMARAGMKPELIAERVGHTDGGALILRRYRHLFPTEVRAAVALLDEFVAAASTEASGREVVNVL